MKFPYIKIILYLAVYITFPFLLFANIGGAKVEGTYTSNKNLPETIILKLNSDRSAAIESWHNGNVISDNGKWFVQGEKVTVKYKDFVQNFKFKKLFLFEYRSFKRVHGLKPLLGDGHGGFLESTKFVDKDILEGLIKKGVISLSEKQKTNYINYISIIFVTFLISGCIGRKYPVIVAIVCMILVPSISYLIDEFHPSLPLFIIVGFVFSLIWSILFKWVLKKTRVRLDSKLRIITGFSSGRGVRNTTIIGPKGTKSRD